MKEILFKGLKEAHGSKVICQLALILIGGIFIRLIVTALGIGLFPKPLVGSQVTLINMVKRYLNTT